MAETIPTPVSTIVDERQRWQGLWQPPGWRDPRWAFGGLLTLYAVLGFTVFGFNRSPWQMLFIVAASVTLDVVYARVVRGRVVFPLSAWISSCSLAILLNYSHGSLMPFFPVLICFAGKNILTIEQRHFYNPAMFAVATSLLIGNGMITASPAYQWSGNAITVTFFLIAAGLSMFVFRVGRTAMIVSFLFFYALQTALRAVIMRHHLPPEMLFIGTMTTPPFFLFTMYMITDPMTSPKSPRMQVVIAFCIAFVDLVLHLKESVFTFFYAALTVATVRFVLAHISLARTRGLRAWFVDELLSPSRVRAVVLTVVLAGGYGLVSASTAQPVAARAVPFSMERVDVKAAGLSSSMSDLLLQVDPRLAHIAKWVMSVGDAVATGDVDGDGKLDLFLSNALKSDADRAAIFLNRSDEHGLRFERLAVPVLDALAPDYKRRGVAAGGAFVDLDSDGDDDLIVTVAFGKSLVLRNDRVETGVVGFTDVSAEVGFDEHTVSLGAVVFDVENDGDLDVLLLNATTPTLPDYETETPLNIFALPQPAYDGDRRMFRFMHNGWHNANNGGPNHLYLNTAGHFARADNAAWGLNDTRWSLAAVAVDFNHDGFTDLYIANDFGPDELYFNDRGERFVLHKGGRLFNSVGNDTYKGMNASTADFDRNGWLDVYISNVHQPLQSEGSLLWMVSPSNPPGALPGFSDEATQRGALNERRFGWGAAAADLDNDGWPDIVQANGMVDDRLDACIPDGQRKDYWYVSQKLMQSGPEVHTYADKWGDIRGRTIFPNEARRAYLNLGEQAPGHFVDVAKVIGIDDPDNSRGVLPADLDNDGDLDLVITNQHGPVSLYRNTLRQQSPTTSHSVCIRPIGNGRTTPRAALGTVATLIVDGRTLLEQSTLMGGFSAQHEPALRFGLGARTTADAVEVLWTDGLRERFAVEVDRCIDVVQGTGAVVKP
jgi:hypothetical protein